jgi:hypothetical protein
MNWVMPSIQRRLRVQISNPASWAGSQQLNSGSSELHGAMFTVAAARRGSVSRATKNEQLMREGEDL